jgi:hypothetical protein
MSRRELDPAQVAARLAALRELYVPVYAAEAEVWMRGERAVVPFAVAVAQRLAELRALDELDRHLRGVAQRKSTSK